MRSWRAVVRAACTLGVGWSVLGAPVVGPAQAATPPASCEQAVGQPCDPSLEAAFARWGATLPGLGSADLGVHQIDATAHVNYVALGACRMVADALAVGSGTDGESDWFAYMATAFPGVGLGEHHELFDAAMAVVCPDLGYERGYDWAASSGDPAAAPTEALPDAPPGTPGWHYVGCAEAFAVDVCSPDDAALYARWGERLPYLYYDPEGTYGNGPSLADYENETVTYDQFNRSALALCQQMDTATDVGAMSEWFDSQSALFPAFSPASHMLFFHAVLTLVCPDVTLPTGVDG